MPTTLRPGGGIRPYNTTVQTDADGTVTVTLYCTPIARLNPHGQTVLLNTGGYDTQTTLRRMNECLAMWGFSRRVRKADFRSCSTLTVRKGEA